MTEERKDSEKPIDYQRREVIKYLGKIGIGATFGGMVGGLIGKTYKTARDFYEENVSPYVKKGGDAIDKIEKKVDNFLDYSLTNKQKEAEKEKEKIDRRGFLILF